LSSSFFFLLPVRPFFAAASIKLISTSARSDGRDNELCKFRKNEKFVNAKPRNCRKSTQSQKWGGEVGFGYGRRKVAGKVFEFGEVLTDF
jgi:hypothetical protein